MNDELMAEVFNLWLKRFQENPEEFGQLTDAGDNYGTRCVEYFKYLSSQIKA
jgi:hypothetical protein